MNINPDTQTCEPSTEGEEQEGGTYAEGKQKRRVSDLQKEQNNTNMCRR